MNNATNPPCISSAWLVSFAAQGIQTYILRSGKLREIVGASELVESLAHDLLDQTLDQLGLTSSEVDVLSRAAGAARLLFTSESHARRFALLWPLLVSQHAPGLTISLALVPALGSPISALVGADQLLPSRRSQPTADLPEAGPFTERHARSGRPIQDDWFNQDGPADRETGRKYSAADSGHRRLLSKILDQSLTTTKLHGQWPLEMEQIVATETDGLALFHADGNGLGQAIIHLLESVKDRPDAEARERYQFFCAEVEKVTLEAIAYALAPIIAETERRRATRYPELKVPFRPLVCAGDDVTVILRDKDAMAFAHTFLKRLQEQMRERLGDAGLQDFTACGALVYLRPKFPLADAYTLCESMCGAAKKAVARRHSALSFVRIASSLPGDYAEFIRRERTLSSPPRMLTMNPYLVATDNLSGPTLDDLLKLENVLHSPDVARGSLRETVADIYNSKEAADTTFARVLQILGQKNKADWESLTSALGRLTRATNPGSLWSETQPWRTPLYDALELHAINRGNQEDHDKIPHAEASFS